MVSTMKVLEPFKQEIIANSCFFLFMFVQILSGYSLFGFLGAVWNAIMLDDTSISKYNFKFESSNAFPHEIQTPTFNEGIFFDKSSFDRYASLDNDKSMALRQNFENELYR